jgi:hemerythrin-like domain-containing protein
MSNDVTPDVRDMYMVHAALRREFRLLAGLVRGVDDGDVERARVVADHITLLDDLLHHHHGNEDKHLWPRLLERGSAEIAPIVHVMESQHEGIDKTSAEVKSALNVWRENADSQVGNVLAGTFERLVPALEEHLQLEEERVLPLIEKYVTQAEWSLMVTEGAQVDPKDMPLLLGMMIYEGDPEVIEKTISHVPAEIQPVIGGLAVEAFTKHSELVHGTATPRRGTER